MPENQENWAEDFEEEIPVLETKNQQLKKKDKGLFVLILLITFLTIGLGSWQFSRNINLPFELAGGGESLNINLSEENELLALQNKDTDGDGLTDFDETTIYKTSIYLEDTDSDGLSDKEEIEKGTDPFCPEGQDCYGTSQQATQDFQPGAGVSGLPGSEASQVGGSVEQLKALLAQAGIPEEILSQISDEELVELYQIALSQTEDQTYLLPEEELSQAGEIGIEQLKALLIQAGISEEILSQFSDEELWQMYQRSMSQEGGQTQVGVENQELYEEIQEMSAEEIKEMLRSVGFDQSILDRYNDEALKQMLLGVLSGSSE